jgi:protein phosphatase 1 regulatory subunit 7
MLTRIQNRIDNPATIDQHLIDEELKAGKLVIVQFSGRAYTEAMLAEINQVCQKYDESFQVRFYGHYSDYFDCNTLLKIPDAKAVWIDCLIRVQNLDAIAKLKFLRKLSIGIFELHNTEILAYHNLLRLSELILTETKTKALNLDYLKNYAKLESLIICGHTKNIESVGRLISLKSLFLNSIKKVPVSFINDLKNLKTLKFTLGGRPNIQEISENGIEDLEITWVRGFNDLSNIGNFKKLQALSIGDNIQLKSLKFEEGMPFLNKLKIHNCKSLDSMIGLENLPQLQQLTISGTALDFEKIISQELPNTLRTFAFYTKGKKVNAKIKNRLERLGYQKYANS